MRRLLPFCALCLFVLLCAASLMDVTEARRGGGGHSSGGGGRGGGSGSGSPRGLSGDVQCVWEVVILVRCGTYVPLTFKSEELLPCGVCV
ncbi:hypothetical protein [Oryza sativa Japonica Group]|uniref:Uncharacterized protein n=1 Tax=Oryza sativa subsp. japonica TaxID=39947 RepID=Q5ZBQ9_ORYSJ|nr:hypothetical protein [Oryza sativa Japonica Group]